MWGEILITRRDIRYESFKTKRLYCFVDYTGVTGQFGLSHSSLNPHNYHNESEIVTLTRRE